MTFNQQSAPILALARAGAISRAWEVFSSTGLTENEEDPAILTLKGRLLKDRARQSRGESSARLYLQSAKAYADAAALRPDTYPLINAATMSLFAGQPDHMALLAQRVLTMLDTGMGVGETPYWHEATRAEALLLLDRQVEAEAAFDKAIIAAPTAWEDRAATLRQFRQIAAFRSIPGEWLAKYAPPASLYFKGMIGVASDDEQAAALAREAVDQTNAGFGYGALAAGADILIAEALAARGAELHLVLPLISSGFRAQSVAQFGADWLPRFDRLFEQATSVTIVAAGETLTASAIDMAAQVAKGAATENARRLEGLAAGLELTDNPSRGFDATCDTLVALERTAPHVSAELAAGQMHFSLVSDQVSGDPKRWEPIAAGFYMLCAPSAHSLHNVLLGLKSDGLDARCAIDISVGNTVAGVQSAELLRLAQCAAPGTTVASASTAFAMLADFPALSVEPLGELPHARGAIEIYAISPAT